MLALGLLVLMLPAAGAATDVQLTVTGAGHLTSIVSVSAANGSALRQAMDGNFGPLVGMLTSNTSQQSSLLGQIATAESTPFLNAYFGNRDGAVSASEVNLFATLLVQESQLLPAGTFTGSPALGATLDGHAPSSVALSGLAFGDAAGPADASTPVTVEPTLSFDFPFSGSRHTLEFTTNLTSVGFTLGPVLGKVNVSLGLPAGQAVTGSTGFASAQVSNDWWGWQSSSFAGMYEPSTHSQLSIRFGDAFPTGYVVVAALSAGAVGVVAFALVRRRRRRQREPPAS